MAQLGRPGLSAAQKRELWQRWTAGQSLSEIGRALEKHSSSIHCVISANGGFVPQMRKRRSTALTLFEREEISRGVAQGGSLRAIAASLRRAFSTISREVARGGGPSRYRAASADEQAWHQARRPQPCLLARHARLRCVVARKLARDWSPEQISGWLVRTYPDDKAMRVSAETIYRSLFIQARGVLKKELQAHRGVRLDLPAQPEEDAGPAPRPARLPARQGEHRVPRPARHRQDPPRDRHRHSGLPCRAAHCLRHRDGVGGAPARRATPGQLADELRRLGRVPLLVVDEVGYRPPGEAPGLFP